MYVGLFLMLSKIGEDQITQPFFEKNSKFVLTYFKLQLLLVAFARNTITVRLYIKLEALNMIK